MGKRTIELPDVPNVVFTQKYYRRYASNFTSSKRYKNDPKKYDKRIEDSKFFFGIENKSIFSYMKRSEAVDKTDLKEIEFQEKAIPQKKILEYMKDRPGSTGLFDAEGSIDDVKAQRLKEFMATTPDMGWSCVMSFMKEYSDEYANNPLMAQRVLKKVVPEQLKMQGLDPDHFYWFAAYHTNTAHRHIHYVVVPKDNNVPIKAYSDKSVMQDMQKAVENFFPPLKEHFPLDRDYFLEEYSKDFEKVSSKLTDRMYSILKGHKQYARLDKTERKIVNSLTWNVLSKNKELKKGLETLKTWAKDKQEQIMTNVEEAGNRQNEISLNYANLIYYSFMNRIYNRTLKLMNDKGLMPQNLEKPKTTERKAVASASKRKVVRDNTIGEDPYKIRRKSIERKHRFEKNLNKFVQTLLSQSAKQVSAQFAVASSYERLWNELKEEEQAALCTMNNEDQNEQALDLDDNELELYLF